MLRAGRSITQASAELKRRRHAGGSGGDADDRLSALPDDLLHAIMSRLKAQQAVQTCVLSTRWKHLWRAVPCLDVDEPELGAGRNFRNFITNLLGGHDVALLEEFRVQALMTADPWVRRAVGQDDAWPCRLKRLHLSYLTNLRLPDLASHISSRCRALEDVRLEDCMFLITTNTKIASSSLRKLVIHGEYMAYGDDDDETFALAIDAPALVSICLGAEEPDVIVDVAEPHAMPSLVDASIRLCMTIDDNDLGAHYRYDPTTPYESGLLAAVYNVTSLHLSHFDIMLLPNEDYLKFPVFNNLRTLDMDTCYFVHDFMGLEPYLRNSRNLQKLTLRRCKVLSYKPSNEVMERIHSYSTNLVDFKCENLRLSEIIYRDGDVSVHLLVKVLVGMWRNLPNNKIEFTKLAK